MSRWWCFPADGSLNQSTHTTLKHIKHLSFDVMWLLRTIWEQTAYIYTALLNKPWYIITNFKNTVNPDPEFMFNCVSPAAAPCPNELKLTLDSSTQDKANIVLSQSWGTSAFLCVSQLREDADTVEVLCARCIQAKTWFCCEISSVSGQFVI